MPLFVPTGIPCGMTLHADYENRTWTAEVVITQPPRDGIYERVAELVHEQIGALKERGWRTSEPEVEEEFHFETQTSTIWVTVRVSRVTVQVSP